VVTKKLTVNITLRSQTKRPNCTELRKCTTIFYHTLTGFKLNSIKYTEE